MQTHFHFSDPYATTAFATVESANIQFLYFIQAISLGSGTGGVRYHTGNRQVDLCSPAGVFARVSPKIQSPAFEKVVEGYFGQNWFIGESSVDMAVHFDASEKGFQSVQLRFLADLVVLNRELFKVVVQMQYLSPRELKRRRKSRIEKYGCSCPMGFDAAGVCKEPINPVDKWAQDRNLNEHMLTFSGEFNASFFWDLVGIKDVYFTFALPIQKGKAQKPFMSLSGVLNVLFIKGLGGAIDIEHPRANFTVVTRLAGLFDVEVSGM